MRATHRLAAIMFSDIANYTGVAHSDESAAARLVYDHRGLLNKAARGFNGEVLQHYGDGGLVIFNSGVDAVDCGLYIQQQASQFFELPLRIGIHLGEILFEGDTFLGDGINIASRIQSLAEVGEVLISETVANVVHNQPNYSLESRGKFELKNVATPIQLYSAEAIGTIEPSSSSQKKRRVSKGTRIGLGVILGLLLIATLLTLVLRNSSLNSQPTSIAVLPFNSLSNEIEDRYFSEGISDDIRSNLARIEGLSVRSRSSSVFAKSKDMSAKELHDALDIQYVLEGSVQPRGTGMVLNLSLINAITDELLEPIIHQITTPEDLVDIQSKIVDDIVDLIHISVLPSKAVVISEKQTTNLDAHRYFILGRTYLFKSGSREDLQKSEEYFRKAIEEDPTYARAYAGLAEVLLFPAAWGYADIQKALPAAREVANQASMHGPEEASTHQVWGTIYEFEKEFELAQQSLKEALRVDPSNELSYLRLSRVLAAQGRFDEALENARKAYKLDPLSPIMGSVEPMILNRAGRFAEAIDASNDLLLQYPGENNLLWQIAESYALAGRYDEAIESLLKRTVSTANVNFIVGYCYGKMGDVERATEVLDYLLHKRESAYVPPAMIAAVYRGLGDKTSERKWKRQETNYFFQQFPVLKY